MNESKEDIQKAHEATESLQGIAAAVERERVENGRADSDPRGEDNGPTADDDHAADGHAVHGHDGTPLEEALRLFPAPVQNPR